MTNWLLWPLVMGLGYGILERRLNRAKLPIAILGGLAMFAACLLTEILILIW